MWKHLAQRLSQSKLLPLIGAAPLILIPLVVVFGGDALRGIGIAMIFACAFFGMYLGQFMAHIITTRFKVTSEELRRRIADACKVFGFLFLPAVWTSLSDSFLGTDTVGPSLLALLFWSCVFAAIGFVASPAAPKE